MIRRGGEKHETHSSTVETDLKGESIWFLLWKSIICTLNHLPYFSIPKSVTKADGTRFPWLLCTLGKWKEPQAAHARKH